MEEAKVDENGEIVQPPNTSDVHKPQINVENSQDQFLHTSKESDKKYDWSFQVCVKVMDHLKQYGASQIEKIKQKTPKFSRFSDLVNQLSHEKIKEIIEEEEATLADERIFHHRLNNEILVYPHGD